MANLLSLNDSRWGTSGTETAVNHQDEKLQPKRQGGGPPPEPHELYERHEERPQERGETGQGLQINRGGGGVEWKREGGKMGEEWRREIRLLCILLAIQTRAFHLRSHQLSNWESDGDVRAARISTRPELGAPLRPNQNTITFAARTDTQRPATIHLFSLLAFTASPTPRRSLAFFPHKQC